MKLKYILLLLVLVFVVNISIIKAEPIKHNNITNEIMLNYNQSHEILISDYFYIKTFEKIELIFFDPILETQQSIIYELGDSLINYTTDYLDIQVNMNGISDDIKISINSFNTTLITNFLLMTSDVVGCCSDDYDYFRLVIQDTIETSSFNYEITTSLLIVLIIIVLIGLYLALFTLNPLNLFGSFAIVVVGFTFLFSSYNFIISIIILILGFILVFKVE